MKIGFFKFLFFFAILSLSAQDIPLPEPQKTGGMPLMNALAQRETNRNFTRDEISQQKLSNLLWAAFGINRENGRRTAPSARNAQEIDLYVFTQENVYLYLPDKNLLRLVHNQDYRSKLVKQEGFVDCPLLLLLVANYDRMEKFKEEDRTFYGAIDAGYISQNIYLYCASENLTTCAIGMIYRDEVKKWIGFNGKAIIAHTIGVKEIEN
ncbi:MAG TPA: SagB/ThcOx family dehydrogenase [Bacteroidales bacterium]|nr:SagB/ThcOx family dehydrogenase [Bacteroidales bacterium]